MASLDARQSLTNFFGVTRFYRWLRQGSAALAVMAVLFFLGQGSTLASIPFVPGGGSDSLKLVNWWVESETKSSSARCVKNIEIFDIAGTIEWQNAFHFHPIFQQVINCDIRCNNLVNQKHCWIGICWHFVDGAICKGAYADKFEEARRFPNIFDLEIEATSVQPDVGFNFVRLDKQITALYARDVFGGNLSLVSSNSCRACQSHREYAENSSENCNEKCRNGCDVAFIGVNEGANTAAIDKEIGDNFLKALGGIFVLGLIYTVLKRWRPTNKPNYKRNA